MQFNPTKYVQSKVKSLYRKFLMIINDFWLNQHIQDKVHSYINCNAKYRRHRLWLISCNCRIDNHYRCRIMALLSKKKAAYI